MKTKTPIEQRCVNYFERRGKGMRYVYARWRCNRKKLKGSDYCSYCEPYDQKQRRLATQSAESRHED